MRRMVSLLVLAVLIWSAYWVWGAQKNKIRMTEWVFEQRAQGWVMEFETLSQLGYPNRFDITLSNPSINMSEGAITWQGKFLQDLRLSYNPNHAIIVFPPTHNFTLGENVFHVSNQQARASVITGVSQEHRIILEASGLEVASKGLKIESSKAQLAISQGPDQHKVHIRFSGLNSGHKTNMNSLTISFDIVMTDAPNRFPIPIMNGLGAHFINLRVAIDGKTIITDGTITVSPDLELDGHIFTTRNIVTGSDFDGKQVNHIQIEDIATPFGIRISRTP
ncbi:MAG: DUF2125 domain-containing protein [Paracoccaceae bacterium]|nr:DUF2125 domain-containing protein [Paracoccaceae bacterium]